MGSRRCHQFIEPSLIRLDGLNWKQRVIRWKQPLILPTSGEGEPEGHCGKGPPLFRRNVPRNSNHLILEMINNDVDRRPVKKYVLVPARMTFGEDMHRVHPSRNLKLERPIYFESHSGNGEVALDGASSIGQGPCHSDVLRLHPEQHAVPVLQGKSRVVESNSLQEYVLGPVGAGHVKAPPWPSRCLQPSSVVRILENHSSIGDNRIAVSVRSQFANLPTSRPLGAICTMANGSLAPHEDKDH